MGPRARSIAALVIASALASVGCMEPLQSGGVMIVGDPGERIAAMCRFRHRDSVSELCGSEDLPPANSATSDIASTNTGQEGPDPGR